MLISVSASQIAARGSKMAPVALKMARKSLKAYCEQVNSSHEGIFVDLHPTLTPVGPRPKVFEIVVELGLMWL